jgi:hypothetical protein
MINNYMSGCGGFGFILSLWTIATKNSIKAIRKGDKKRR